MDNIVDGDKVSLINKPDYLSYIRKHPLIIIIIVIMLIYLSSLFLPMIKSREWDERDLTITTSYYWEHDEWDDKYTFFYEEDMMMNFTNFRLLPICSLLIFIFAISSLIKAQNKLYPLTLLSLGLVLAIESSYPFYKFYSKAPGERFIWFWSDAKAMDIIEGPCCSFAYGFAFGFWIYNISVFLLVLFSIIFIIKNSK